MKQKLQSFLTKNIQTYRKLLVWFCFITLPCFAFTQNITVSGYITDDSNGEALISANVYCDVYQSGTVSNTYGFYSLTLARSESLTLTFSYIGFDSKTITIPFTENQIININLEPSNVLNEVVVEGKRQIKIQEQTQMSTIDIPIAQIKKIPALLGETDVLKVLQLLPGVQSGGEGQSGLYVRGGSPDQNLVLLDGVPVYNASHLFGFFSVFNTDAIKDVKLVKGGFPARYGGRLSSVIDITMKEGSTKKLGGTASIGLVASRFTLEGPIGKNEKTSFIVSARRTYIDLLARPIIKSSLRQEGIEGSTGYYFYDLNAKINHKISDKDRLFFSIYGGRDRFYLNTKEEWGSSSENPNIDELNAGLGWGNITSALRWNRSWTPKLFSNTTLIYSQYDLSTLSEFGSEYPRTKDREFVSLDYSAGIEDYGVKIDFDYAPIPQHLIKFGTGATHHQFNPGVFKLQNIDTRDMLNFNQSIGQKTVNAIETNTYVEDDWEINKKFKINAGLHFSTFHVNNKNYGSLQPRLSARYLLSPTASLKASWANMQQFIHLLSNEGIGLPTDLWVPTTDRISPQKSWQAAVGYSKTWNEEYEFTIEAYYKDMDNVMSFAEGEGIFAVTDWQTRVTQGSARSYGGEVFLQRKTGRFTGWTGYTLSWTERRFDDLNEGRWFPFRYDRRHDLSLVGMYELSPKIDISATWVFGTGNAVTIPNSISNGHMSRNNPFYFPIQFFDNRNDFRMENYHRLDVGINIKKKKPKYERIWSFGAYNAYSRNNPFFVYLGTDYTYDINTGSFESKPSLKQLALFPIIPYFSWTITF